MKTLVERAYLICSTPRLLRKELTHIRTVFKNTHDYLNSTINQVFEQIKDKTKFEHRRDVVYLGTCPETTYNDNYIGEAKHQIFERVKDHNDRDIKSHLLKHTLESNHDTS